MITYEDGVSVNPKLDGLLVEDLVRHHIVDVGRAPSRVLNSAESRIAALNRVGRVRGILHCQGKPLRVCRECAGTVEVSPRSAEEVHHGGRGEGDDAIDGARRKLVAL